MIENFKNVNITPELDKAKVLFPEGIKALRVKEIRDNIIRELKKRIESGEEKSITLNDVKKKELRWQKENEEILGLA